MAPSGGDAGGNGEEEEGKSIELRYPDGCNSIKRTLHLGPWRKRAYQEPAVREVLWPSIVSCEGGMNTFDGLSTFSPFSCHVIHQGSITVILILSSWNLCPPSQTLQSD
ncbi:unnamed protein product [Pleuronectes platessa]|uniref:Uncharacterized protein n=1 Tax=Pleuronectes platessa TaxID=8262 RepID=A0A9N7TY34_PLEPL|nr:unnamed protein product [Pleuronectes platessa]